jgi:transposase
MQHKLLSDKQWKHLQPLLPKLRSKGRPWADNRAVLEGILWVLKTGARWRDLPKEYPSASTCWRRLRLWEERDVWLRIWRAFLSELDQRGRLDWSESFLDASFAPAKKGASRSAKPAKAKVVADGKGIPLGSQLASAQAAEVKLAETTLEQISVPRGGPGRPLKRPKAGDRRHGLR